MHSVDILGIVTTINEAELSIKVDTFGDGEIETCSVLLAAEDSFFLNIEGLFYFTYVNAEAHRDHNITISPALEFVLSRTPESIEQLQREIDTLVGEGIVVIEE